MAKWLSPFSMPSKAVYSDSARTPALSSIAFFNLSLTLAYGKSSLRHASAIELNRLPPKTIILLFELIICHLKRYFLKTYRLWYPIYFRRLTDTSISLSPILSSNPHCMGGIRGHSSESTRAPLVSNVTQLKTIINNHISLDHHCGHRKNWYFDRLHHLLNMVEWFWPASWRAGFTNAMTSVSSPRVVPEYTRNGQW